MPEGNLSEYEKEEVAYRLALWLAAYPPTSNHPDYLARILKWMEIPDPQERAASITDRPVLPL